MADQNITALPVATAPASSDQLLLVGATEEKLIDYDKLADAILQKLTSKTFTLDQGVMTLLKALNELNSNKTSSTLLELSDNIDDFLNKASSPKAYFVWGTIGGLFGGWAWGVLICAQGIANFIGIRNDNRTLAAAHYEKGTWSKISTWSD